MQKATEYLANAERCEATAQDASLSAGVRETMRQAAETWRRLASDRIDQTSTILASPTKK
jgi:hypothetical protein